MIPLTFAFVILVIVLIALPEKKVVAIHRKIRGLFKKAANKIDDPQP